MDTLLSLLSLLQARKRWYKATWVFSSKKEWTILVAPLQKMARAALINLVLVIIGVTFFYLFPLLIVRCKTRFRRYSEGNHGINLRKMRLYLVSLFRLA